MRNSEMMVQGFGVHGFKPLLISNILTWTLDPLSLKSLSLTEEFPANQEDAEQSDGQHGKSHHI